MKSLIAILMAILSLLTGCVAWDVQKPDPQTGEGGFGTSDPLQGVVAGSVVLYGQLTSVSREAEIYQAADCMKPTPYKFMDIVILKNVDGKAVAIKSIPVEQKKFRLPLELPSGRYRVQLRDSRLDRTLDEKGFDTRDAGGFLFLKDSCK